MFVPVNTLLLATSAMLVADNIPAFNVEPHCRTIAVRTGVPQDRDICLQQEQAAKQQQEWDQSGPVSGGQQGQQMQNMPGMHMPRQQASPTPTPQPHQMDQMPGMKMPQEQSQPSPAPNN